jgi:uncharacterized protein (TIGR02757 family)
MQPYQTEALKAFLDQKTAQYNQPSFIKEDPIAVPHLFTSLQDIEIAAFFAATFAWGNRTIILNKTRELMQLMEMQPYAFIRDHAPEDLKAFLHFKHRTFNTTDLLYFIRFLQYHYASHRSLEEAFFTPEVLAAPDKVKAGLTWFHHYFFSLDDYPPRTRKHVATPYKQSNCKRLNMFLRWMVRKDDRGVDFGLWKRILPADLIIPIDLHVARVARRFGLSHRKQMDWNAAVELTEHLRQLDETDPVKYDFALFGLGVVEKFC